jgi:hypothetical protein
MRQEVMTEEQLQLLELIVDAYWSNQEGQSKDEFVFSTGFGDARTTLTHEHFSDKEPRADLGDIRELDRLGVIAAEWESPNQGRFRPTAPGKRLVEDQRHLAEIQRADREISGGGPGIDFSTHLPVLEAVVHLYGEAAAGQDVSQMDVAGIWAERKVTKGSAVHSRCSSGLAIWRAARTPITYPGH